MNFLSFFEVEIPEYNATVLFPIKYSYVTDGVIQHQTSQGEKHQSNVKGKHSVFWKNSNPNIITETIFPVLESAC